MISRLLRIVAACAAALVLGSPLAADPLGDALPSVEDPMIAVSAHEVLERALDNLYGSDIAQDVDLVVTKNGREVRRHMVTLLRKKIGGRSHTLFDYRLNNEFYGLRSLRIERREGVYDRFLYLPEFKRVRRFSGSQRADLVLGTNLHFEDLEVRTTASFAIVGRSVVDHDGMRMHQLEVEPRHEIDYDRADVLIDPETYAIRRIRYLRDGDPVPLRILTAPADEMVPFTDRILPSHWIIEEGRTDLRTDVYFRRIRTDPDVKDGLFSARTLEATPDLPAFEAP